MSQTAKNKPESGDARPCFQSSFSVVEVKRGLSAVRDLRDVLVQLARWLAVDKRKNAYLVLLDPRLSTRSLNGEMDGFAEVFRRDIADRIRLFVVKEGEISGKTGEIPDDVLDVLRECTDGAPGGKKSTLPRPSKRDEVFLVILNQWISGAGPMTSRWIEDVVGCTYRTVSATLETLGPALRRHSDRRIELKVFPEEAWRRFIALGRRARATMHFADPSDQPRSTEGLLRRLERLGRSDVVVGGVPGAKRYDPHLDIAGIPRLDLGVHAPGNSVDLAFVQELDPALEPTRDLHRPIRLALHFIRRKSSLFVEDRDGRKWPDPVECLFHLHEGRLDVQASAFMEHLVARGKRRDGGI